MTTSNQKNPAVIKTIKLFIGGEFQRSESGKVSPIYFKKNGIPKKLFANVPIASRKDFRNAVTASIAALSNWSKKSAYNRGQILYRMAEMAQGQRPYLIEILKNTLGQKQIQAEADVNQLIDAFVYFAGWTDKYQQVLAAVNPVSGPYLNFTKSEPVGVVGLIAASPINLSSLGAQIAAIVASGNTVVVLLSGEGQALIAPLSEIFATSDLTKGAVNLLTGNLLELIPQFGTHMEIHALSCQSLDKKILAELKKLGAENLKRVVPPIKENLSLEHLENFLEYKTIWHPIGE